MEIISANQELAMRFMNKNNLIIYNIMDVIIFGCTDTAQLAHYYLTNDSIYNVVCFTVNEKYMPLQNKLCELPIIPFENITELYPTSTYKMFVPMTGKYMNKLREKIYYECKNLGYQLISYISSKATVLTENIGENCFILEDNTIQPFVTIGNNCVFWSGNHIGHHSIIKDHVFFTSHVVLSGHCTVNSYCWFGVNATIRNALDIGEGTLAAMSASIVKNTDEWSIYMGIPAKKSDKRSDDETISEKL